MSHETTPRAVTIDEIPVDPAIALSDALESAAVPDEIKSITEALVSTTPPSNPLVVLKVARWWYANGDGVTDPVFLWALEWTRSLATDQPPDVTRYHECLDYLVEVGFADGRQELRDAIEE